ncbi:MAG TPA: DUF4381 family protein [Steroidobacteraceae bacterium]|jgi:hypothetical protein|nr:DUF4381 family protein [Steroidobacteraceae bacterium]
MKRDSLRVGMRVAMRVACGLPAMFLGMAIRAAPAVGDIRDIRGPKYVLPYWVPPALILGVVLIAAAIYALWRRRGNRGAPPLLPYEIALNRLEEIRSLMQPSSAREFSTAVSDIIRRYIELRFDVTVTRRTTEEFLRDLLVSSNQSLARHQGLLGDFLHQCDFVKFAALSLTVNNMESLLQSARAFVLTTAKPPETPAAEEARDSLPAT